MNLNRLVKRYRQKVTAPGCPFRYLRKAALMVRNVPRFGEQTRLRGDLTREIAPSMQRQVDELNATGFARAGEEIDPALLQELATLASERLAAGGGAALRSFFTRISSDEDLRTDNVLIRFALQEKVLKLVSAYFGHLPYLADVQLLLSHGSDREKWEESQLWHRDYADSKTVKLWVYLTDVDTMEKGPFTYLKLQDSQRVKNGLLFPGRVSDEAMEASGLAASAETVYGSRLSTFYIDTSRCYHLGSRLKGDNIRLAYVATFITHASLYPFDNRIQITNGVSPLEKHVLAA